MIQLNFISAANALFQFQVSVIAVFILMLNGYSALSQTPANDPHWVLNQSWDFTTMSLVTLSQEWVTNPCVKALDHGSGSVEPQCYRGDNVTLSGTGLRLTVKKQTITGKLICYQPNNYLLSDGVQNYRTTYYTSGYVETLDSLKYGYIESRIKLPYGYDFFPAFWTFKMSGAAANGAEIDIFEMLPAENYPNNSAVAKTNCHLFYGAPGEPYDPGRNENIALSSSYTNYHKYAVEWNPAKITWYFDDVVVRVLINPGVHDYTKTILNLALNPWNFNPNLSTYPSNMEVEYVKWYKLNNTACNTVVNDCVFNFGAYTPTVKKSITIGGSGCSNTQPASTSLTLRATDFVLLTGEFTVPAGSSLYIDVNPCY